MTTCYAPAAPRPATRVHELSPGQLERVLAEVWAVDTEQGLAACFAVADAVGMSSDAPGAHIRHVALPAWQWRRIETAVADRAEALVPGSSPEVLRDWADLGPRISHEL